MSILWMIIILWVTLVNLLLGRMLYEEFMFCNFDIFVFAMLLIILSICNLGAIYIVMAFAFV